MSHLFKYILFIVLPLVYSSSLWGQTKVGGSDFCDKKWIVERYQEANGETFQPPKAAKNDYMIYHCNGTFESLEEGTVIKGNWVFNTKEKLITVTQNQTKNYPSRIITKVKKISGGNMVIEGPDAGGDKLTLFLKAQK